MTAVSKGILIITVDSSSQKAAVLLTSFTSSFLTFLSSQKKDSEHSHTEQREENHVEAERISKVKKPTSQQFKRKGGDPVVYLCGYQKYKHQKTTSNTS